MASAINTLSCIVNFDSHSPCSKDNNQVSAYRIDIASYINRVNRFNNFCNMSPNTTFKNTFLLAPQVDGILNVNCAGSVPPLDYNFTKQCGLEETYSMLQACQNQYPKKYGWLYSDPTKFLTIIYNLPSSCQGISNKVGQIFIQSSQMNNENALIHEIGHSNGLEHSGTDCSDPMGCAAASANLCFNAPNSRRLGWANPISILDQSLLPQDRWLSYKLPIFTTAFNNHFVIPIGKSGCDLYFSLRSSHGTPFADSGIHELQVVNANQKYVDVQNTVAIHALNQTSDRSKVVDHIPVNSTWDFAPYAQAVCGPQIGKQSSKIALFHKQYQFKYGSHLFFCFYSNTMAGCKKGI